MQSSPSKEMSFADHLEELRWHIIRSAIAVVVIGILAFIYMDFIFDHIILAPLYADFWTYRLFCKLSEFTCFTEFDVVLQNRTIAGQFTMHFMAAIVSGLIVAFPYLFWEFWRFVKPGLSATEKKYASGAVLFVSILFLSGILFGYYVVTPLSINFLINYKISSSAVVQNFFDLSNYISFICMLVVGSGLMFQLPVVIYILSRIGIVGPNFLRMYRKHAIVGIFIVAAVVTPSPDFITQLVVAVPLYILYEISIFLSAAVVRNREKEMYNS